MGWRAGRAMPVGTGVHGLACHLDVMALTE